MLFLLPFLVNMGVLLSTNFLFSFLRRWAGSFVWLVSLFFLEAFWTGWNCFTFRCFLVSWSTIDSRLRLETADIGDLSVFIGDFCEWIGDLDLEAYRLSGWLGCTSRFFMILVLCCFIFSYSAWSFSSDAWDFFYQFGSIWLLIWEILLLRAT